MYNFLVLGLIPGTNIQITLRSWIVSVTLALAYLAYRLLNSRHLQPQPLRVPLHARQLHRRA